MDKIIEVLPQIIAALIGGGIFGAIANIINARVTAKNYSDGGKPKDRADALEKTASANVQTAELNFALTEQLGKLTAQLGTAQEVNAKQGEALAQANALIAGYQKEAAQEEDRQKGRAIREAREQQEIEARERGYEQQMNEQRAQIEKMSLQIKMISDNYSAVSRTNAAYATKINDIEKHYAAEIKKLKQQYDAEIGELRQQVSDQNKLISDLQAENADLRSRLNNPPCEGLELRE